MASIRKRGDKWYVEICVNGKRKGKTFESKLEANRWASIAESDMHKQSGESVPIDKTFSDLIMQHLFCKFAEFRPNNQSLIFVGYQLVG